MKTLTKLKVNKVQKSKSVSRKRPKKYTMVTKVDMLKKKKKHDNEDLFLTKMEKTQSQSWEVELIKSWQVTKLQNRNFVKKTKLKIKTILKIICVKRSPSMRSHFEEQDFDARLGSKTGKPCWRTVPCRQKWLPTGFLFWGPNYRICRNYLPVPSLRASFSSQVKNVWNRFYSPGVPFLSHVKILYLYIF